METFKRIASGKYRVSHSVSPEAADLIKRLLNPVPAKRLGMLRGGEKDVLGHKVCAHIDAGKLEKRAVKLPFVPRLKDPTDTSNFDNYPVSTLTANDRKYEKYLDKKYDDVWAKEFA